MRYQEYQPPIELASWIKLFWVFESRSNDPVPETIVADGFPELIIQTVFSCRMWATDEAASAAQFARCRNDRHSISTEWDGAVPFDFNANAYGCTSSGRKPFCRYRSVSRRDCGIIERCAAHSGLQSLLAPFNQS